MEGWIKLHRQIIEHPDYFSEPFTRVMAWIDLLMLANHKGMNMYVRGNKVEIKRGDTAIAQETLATRWKWSRTKVKRYLNELEKDRQIVQQKSNVINTISIVNYDAYQSDDTTESTADDTTEDQQKADRKPAENPQKSTNKNVKNVKNDKKAHTQFFSGKDKTRAREVSQKAQDMLRWIETHTPSVQLMEFPITLRQAQAIVERMDDEDVIRILTDMCNKGATKRCRSAINTFNSYASRDFILKEKREKARNHEAIQRGFVKK
jgi:hypothetical protein